MNLEELDRWLDENDMRGYWARAAAEATRGRRSGLSPHIWRWSAMSEALEHATEVVRPEDSFRRHVSYNHPDMKEARGGGICATFSVGVQCVLPGELPPSHRHRFGAMRFVIEGSGSGTVVDGEDFPMQPGDLITTPSMTWHDHYNRSDSRILWLDIVDPPILGAFQIPTRGELFPKPVQDVVRGAGTSAAETSVIRPIWKQRHGTQPPPFRYPWDDTRRALELLAEEDGDPYDGITVRYLDPVSGGSTLPTLMCEMQMLRVGEVTRAHRHTSTVVYHAFRGRGRTTINGETFDWERGDTFVIPVWADHHHENSHGESAYLFTVSDRGAIEALSLYQEEPA